MTDREIMQQALEALDAYSWEQVQSATTTLRERLAQPEQEPVSWLYRDSWGTMKLSQVTPPPVGAFPVYTAPPQRKPEQEPSVEQLNSAIEAWFENFETRSYQERMQHAFKAAHGIKGEA